MSLERRIAKIENLTDHRGVSDDEFRDAHALLARHFAALGAPELFGGEADPSEVAAMHAAEASGQIAKAKDVIDRWKRARRINLEEEERRAQEATRELIDFFGRVAAGIDAARDGDGVVH